MELGNPAFMRVSGFLLFIMLKAKTMEERHFYITLCIKESYLSRGLERQIESRYYERYMLSNEKLLPEPIKALKENPFWILIKFMPANIETKSNANAKPPVMRVVGEILESLFRRKEIDI